jgi:hypothetical protein
MISVNVARNTCEHLLNKNNRGFVGVEQMNSFFQLAQLDLFEQLFFDYNQWLNKENRRLVGTEYANIPKNIQEIIDSFGVYTSPSNFTYDDATDLWSYTGTDLYRAINLSLVNGHTGKRIDIEQVNKSELNRINNSNVTAPSLLFPVCVNVGDGFRVYPTLSSPYSAELFFIRKPKDPKWTYTLVSGNPIYNASATDLQHVELPYSMFSKFIVKVLLYCGVSIREEEVVGVAGNEEVKEFQKQQ